MFSYYKTVNNIMQLFPVFWEESSQDENFAGIYFCNWASFYVLREEIFADCNNLKFLWEFFLWFHDFCFLKKKMYLFIFCLGNFVCARRLMLLLQG